MDHGDAPGRRRRARAAHAAITLAAMLGAGACASGPSRAAVDRAGGETVVLRNRTSDTVCYLYLSPPGEDEWGRDRLGSGTISPGEQQRVALPPGTWDMRTENCQHEPTGLLRGAVITRATVLVLQ